MPDEERELGGKNSGKDADLHMFASAFILSKEAFDILGSTLVCFLMDFMSMW